MTLRAIKRPPRTKRAQYHHGNLKQALVGATVKLIEERGVEKVSVREAAKRVGVSSGAPFRHFPTRTALLTAVAEQAMRLLLDAMTDALARHRNAGPMERFRALGGAYMRWAIAHPTQFAIVSNRKLIDYDGSASLGPDNDKIRALMDGVLRDARAHGLLRSNNVDEIVLAARATAYGVARMHVDGHFAQWAKGHSARNVFESVFDLFISAISADA
ncbi:MAG TPA: TetR/AcrR family transcriptional regulator [Candidatus Binataceae bacterium]|nr:TetR/AcrR family transcriptional regulator [Candidatus Binataceae bacterium]